PPDDLGICSQTVQQDNSLITQNCTVQNENEGTVSGGDDDLTNSTLKRYPSDSSIDRTLTLSNLTTAYDCSPSVPSPSSLILSSSLPDMKQLYSSLPTQISQNIQQTITTHSTSDDVQKWLELYNFHTIMSLFRYYTGLDILRLNVDDVLRICGDCIGIRLYNQLKQTPVPPLKTLYIKQLNDDYYHCIYLHSLTRKELLQKIIEQFQLNKISSVYCQFYIEQQQQELKIIVDDDVVKYSIL
ncbi:unnamed protein product, partial [Didymodactylos carnosus]